MKNLSERQPATFETVWAALQETDRVLSEKFAESDRLRKENERILKEQFAETNRVLNEKFAETDRIIKELAKQTAETDRQMKETDRQMKETDRIVKETSKQVAETDRVVKETSKQLGGIANSNGDVAESYFVNSFANHLHFAGQDYDSHVSNITKSVKKLNLKDQYDLVLYNCSSVVIIEIKYKAKKEDINQVLKKAQTFKQLFPEYAHYDLYLGLAGLDVEAAAEKEAMDQGVAIIKQVGDTMVVHDDYLKVF